MNVYCKNMIIFFKKEASINNLYINDDIYYYIYSIIIFYETARDKKNKSSVCITYLCAKQ